MNLARTGGARQQAAIYVVSNVVSRALSFALLPALTYLLTPEEFGLWGVATAWSNLATLLLLFGMYTPVSSLYFDEPDDRRRREAYGTIFLFQVVGGAVTASLIATVLSTIEHVRFAPHLRLAAWIGYFTSLNLIPLALMRVREQAKRHAFVSLAAATASTVGPLVSVWLGERSAYDALVGLCYGSAVSAVVYVWLLRRDVSLRFSFPRLVATLRYSLQFVPHSAASWALSLADRVLIQAMLGRAMAGVYTAGYVLASGVSLVIEGIGNSWLTFFLKAEREIGNRPKVVAAATRFVSAAAACGLAGALFLPLVVRWGLPAAYAAAEPVAIVVVLGLTLTAPYLVWVYTVMTIKRLTIFPLVTIAAAATNLLLNLWLVPRFGILAAAVNTIVGYTVLAGLTALVASRVYPIRYNYGRWASALAVAFGAGVLALVCPPLPIGAEIAWRGAMMVVAPAVLALLGFFHQDEVAAFQSLLSGIWRRPPGARRI